MIRQVTWGKEKPSCSRESDSTVAVPAGVIIRGQKSILLMACPSHHVNQYAQSGVWHTRVGKFNFVGGGTPDTHADRHSYCHCKRYANSNALRRRLHQEVPRLRDLVQHLRRARKP